MFTWGQYEERMYWFFTDTPESLIMAAVIISRTVEESFKESMVQAAQALLAEGYFFPAKAEAPRRLQAGKPLSPESRPYKIQLDKMYTYVTNQAAPLWQQSLPVLKRYSNMHSGSFEDFMRSLLNMKNPAKVADFLLAHQFRIGIEKDGSKKIICPKFNIPATQDEIKEMLEYVTAACSPKTPGLLTTSSPQ